jgi:hypothetical protein
MSAANGNSLHSLVGKRVHLINPSGYPRYGGTVRGHWAPFRGSRVYDDWADIDWDHKVHPCTNPMEIKHLRLANARNQGQTPQGESHE